MTELLTDWLPIVAAISFGIFVQAAAGFAAGTLIVPVLLWFGYTIPAAQAALLIATIPQNAWGVWSFREEISAKQVVIPGCARIVFFPVGLLVLGLLERFPSEVIRQIVGAFILTVTLTTVVANPQPKDRVHWGWSWATFPLSGFFQGLVGMGGPVMVLWVQMHDWGVRRSRAFLFAMYLISTLPALAMLFWSFGDRVIGPAIGSIASMPMIWVATHFGLKTGSRMGRKRLRRVTLAMLLAIGLMSLLAPWLRYVSFAQ